jgi:hypothetical protein
VTNGAHMLGDPKELRERAKSCWELASRTSNPALRQSLTEAAQMWVRLAAEQEFTNALLDIWGDPTKLSGDVYFEAPDFKAG